MQNSPSLRWQSTPYRPNEYTESQIARLEAEISYYRALSMGTAVFMVLTGLGLLLYSVVYWN